MDYSKKTCKELIALCKEKGITGYSGKKKEEIYKLLCENTEIKFEPLERLQHTGKIRYIDLFCGLGAFHTAFNTSDIFECVLACDIDDGIRNIYKANYDLEPTKDIRKLDIETIRYIKLDKT
jgi:hypothetical protein